MSHLTLDWLGEFRVQPAGFEPVTPGLISDIVQRIIRGVQPEKIILFGSYAIGNPSSDSDLDFLVIMNTDERNAERVVTISRLLRPRPFPMDILVRTPEEIADAVKSRDPFFLEILSQGKVLYASRK